MQSLAEKKVEIFTSWEIAKKWSDTYVTEVDRENSSRSSSMTSMSPSG